MFNQTSAGTPYIIIDGIKYPCTSVDISLSINAVPTATVLVGLGVSITNPAGKKASDPNALLAALMARQESSAYKDLINCTIIEERATSKDTTLTLFQGFIITATLQKSADAKSACAQITCVSAAARLMCNPLSGPAIIRGGYNMLQWIMNPKNTRSDTATDMTKGPLAVVQQNLTRRYSIPPDSPLSTRIGNALTAVICEFLRVSRGDWIAEEEYNRYINLFRNTLTSKWALGGGILNTNGYASQLEAATEYDRTLTEKIANSLNNSPSSILDVMFGVLASEDYMLCAAPRLFADGTSWFEIMPKAGWIGNGNVPCVALYSDCISSFTGHYNPHRCLNTPDVYILQMDNTNMSLTDSRVGVTTQFGIYSTSADTRAAWRRLLNGNTNVGYLANDIEQVTVHRAVVRPTPRWVSSLCRLVSLNLQAVAEKEAQKKFDIRNLKTPKVPEGTTTDASGSDLDDEGRQAKANSAASVATKVQAYQQELLNTVARAMFMAEFGMSDSCAVSLPFGCSFGRDASKVRVVAGGGSNRLEEHIGDLVAVFPDDGGMTGIGVVGVLNSLHYSVSLGKNAASAEYTVSLSQVHSWSAGNGGMAFPIYTRVK